MGISFRSGGPRAVSVERVFEVKNGGELIVTEVHPGAVFKLALKG
jgi:hypothetical protein